ncbi:MAG: hypothetical protein HeimC3_48760 [Candidatus Heimdallarchaeota archaeon LC_3]|nr:MAG: hypothetical protein HeimC3_48760 [Candidatus Heimdallarchaeota archaeon LC_3]
MKFLGLLSLLIILICSIAFVSISEISELTTVLIGLVLAGCCYVLPFFLALSIYSKKRDTEYN